MQTVEWIVFDLGGVLVEYVGAKRMLGWTPKFTTEEDLHRCWFYSPAVREFESGRISPLIFAERVVSELGLLVHPDIFLQEFPDFVTGYYPGADELLAELSSRYDLAVLSNTNSPQWDKLSRMSGMADYFKKLFLSYKTGHMKPDRDTFLHMVSQLGCAPGRILFFDDNPDNVRGALNAGIKAVLVRDFEDTKRIITEMGLLG